MNVIILITINNISYSIAGNIDIEFNDGLTISRPTIKLISINMNFPDTISPGAVSLRQIKICQNNAIV